MTNTRAKFPSPCGENPLSHGLRRARSPLLSPTVTSSPGRGKSALSRGSLVQVNGSCKSSPFGRAGAQRLRGFLRGEIAMEVNAQEKYYLSRFRPLTGMVLISWHGGSRLICFRPLTGMVLSMMTPL